jgi:AraC-like DNA-binding protein
MEFENVSFPFKAGDITCVPKYLPHTTYSSPDTQSLWSYIFLDPEVLFFNMFNNLSPNFDRSITAFSNDHLIMNKDEYPKVYYLVTSIIEELISQKACYQTSVRGLLLSLYIELVRIHQTDMEQREKEDAKKKEVGNILTISSALEFIHKNYMQPICIDDLAALCHLSISHFRRTFHEIMGTAPLNYLNSTRIDEACWLLKSTEDSILTISEKVGFNSISSFNRCFIKLMKIPPNVWRKQSLLSDFNSPKATILEFTGWI